MEKMKIEQERKKAIFAQEAAKEKVPKPNISIQFYWGYHYSVRYLETKTVASNKAALGQYSIFWVYTLGIWLFLYCACLLFWVSFCKTCWKKSWVIIKLIE